MAIHRPTNARARRQAALLLHPLEPRTLLSAISLAPGSNALKPLALAPAAALHTLAQLPNESSIASPKFSDQWYLQNTGQTLTNSPFGPDAGTSGADIKATSAWDTTTGSRNVVIAMLDTVPST